MTGYGQHFKKMKASKGSDPALSGSAQVTSSKRKRRPKRPKRQPAGALLWASLIGFVLCLAAVLWEEQVESYLAKVQIHWTGGKARAQEKAPRPLAQEGENLSADDSAEPLPAPSEIQSWGPDELSVLTDLTRRKKQLDERERHLVQLDAELQRRMVEVEERIRQLEASRREIAKLLEDHKREDAERMEKLVETYSGMKPQNAARVLAGLDADLAISILSGMRKQNASDIMNFMDPEIARELSERFVGYRK